MTADRAGSRVNREAGGGRGGHRGRRRADHRAVRGEPAAPAAQPVRGDHVRAQRSGAAQVDHGPEPVRGGQRIIPAGGGPDPEGEPAARRSSKAARPCSSAQGSEIAYVNFGQLKGSAISGVGQPDGGYHPAASGRSWSRPCSTSSSRTSSPSSRACSTGSATSSPATRTTSSRSTCWPSRRSRPRRGRARCWPRRSTIRPAC